MPFDTYEGFEEFFGAIVKRAKEAIITDGSHIGIFIMLQGDGKVGVVPFDLVREQFQKESNISAEQAKEAAFIAVGQIAKKQKCVGYIHITEGWTISVPEGSSPEDAQKFLDREKAKHGRSLESIPGRLEVLSIVGRYKDRTRLILFKIKRLGNEICLEPAEDHSSKYEPVVQTKIWHVEKEIDAVLGYPSPGNSGEDHGLNVSIRWR